MCVCASVCECARTRVRACEKKCERVRFDVHTCERVSIEIVCANGCGCMYHMCECISVRVYV